ELHFAVTWASSEDQAVDEFLKGLPDFILIDYHLSAGNGLSCLQSLRRHDAHVPIVAVSGQATPEIAAQLLQCGADAYISKPDLSSDGLARSIRLALARADVWRRRTPAPAVDANARLKAALQQVCKTFATALGSNFLRR